MKKKQGFLLFIVSTLFILLSSHKSHALLGDISVALRCDETYSISNLCFPADAILQDDGSCACPAGGCANCPKIGVVDDYYCHYPVNILSTLANRELDIKMGTTVTLHYEELFYPNSCGSRHSSGFDCGSFMLLSSPAIAAATAAGPFALAAVMVGLGSYCAAKSGSNEPGWVRNKYLDILFNDVEDNSSNIADLAETGHNISSVFLAPGEAINPNRYYGIQPRLEFTDIEGTTTPVVRLYFTQADKHDDLQIIFPNLGSHSNDDDYFAFGNNSFSDNWNTPLAGVAGAHMWRPIKLCSDSYGNPGHSSPGSGGVSCHNTDYFNGLLVNTSDPSEGFKIPPPPAEPFFPTAVEYFSGGQFRMLSPPSLTWQIDPASSFTNPIVNVTFTDAIDILNNSSVTVNILENTVTHIHSTPPDANFRYQLYTKIENNDNIQKQKQLCLYACPTHPTNPTCLGNTAIATGLSIDAFITHNDLAIRDVVKTMFLIPPSEGSIEQCVLLTEIPDNDTIEVTGLGIGSTYDSPKIKVKITQGGMVTENKIYDLMNKQDIYDTVNLQEFSTPYLHNNSNKQLLKPHISTIRQDLNLGIVNSATGPACTGPAAKPCPSGYYCAPCPASCSGNGDSCVACSDGSSCSFVANKCNDGTTCGAVGTICPSDQSTCTATYGCANGDPCTKCADNSTCVASACSQRYCNIEGKLCQLYNFLNDAISGPHLQDCNTSGANTYALNHLSEDIKSFMCLHNVYPINGTTKPHPYNINKPNLITNSYKVLNPGFNANLCVPTPKKIESISYTIIDDNKLNPISDVLITYKKPKPFLNYEADDFTTLLPADQGLLVNNEVIGALNNHMGPPSYTSSCTPSNASPCREDVRFDYHNNYRFTYENLNGIYSISLRKYNDATNVYEIPSIPGLDGSGRIEVSGSPGVYTTNLNYCPAGVLPGVPNSNMPETAANTNDVIGSCTSTCAGSSCTTPQADCDSTGTWNIDAGHCVNACPAKTVAISNGTITFPETPSDNSVDVVVSGNAGCYAGYGGTITASDTCQSDGTWLNNDAQIIASMSGSCSAMPCSTRDISVTHSGSGWVYDYTLPNDIYVGQTINVTCDNTFLYRHDHGNGYIHDSYFSSTGSKVVPVTCNSNLTISVGSHDCNRQCYVWDNGYFYMEHNGTVRRDFGRCGFMGSGKEYKNYSCNDGHASYHTSCHH